MIAFVKGEIEHLSDENVVLDTGTLGYNIRISANTAEKLAAMDGEIKLYTFTCVREDAFLLYGFLNREELDLFKKLITVNGIGPKGGLAILSVMTADDLRFAIMAGDSKAIAKAPGIGAKTASKVILDLKDKIRPDDVFLYRDTPASDAKSSSGEINYAKEEAIEALVALGYSPSDALKAVKKANPAPDADTETILKLALKNMF